MPSERQIHVGNVAIGGGAPVAVQSMTLTKTHDVEATTAQIAVLASAGCEVVRGAVLSVPRGQWEAALAVNMTPFQRMLHVILPQAVLAMLPPMGNLIVDLLKATSLVSLITLSDLTFQARILQNSLGHTTEVFLLVILMYFILSYLVSTAVRWLERRASYGQEVRRVQVTVT